jgi:hypothetical protein
VDEVNASESDVGLDFELEPKTQIIDMKANAIIVTTKIHPSEPDEPEEGEHLFHSHIWMKGNLLHFIVDRDS